MFFVALAIAALLVRLPQLELRPMHTDEAVNAYITGQLLAGETYQYDPQDRHGPALYLAAAPLARAAGAKNLASLSEPMLRRLPAIFSAVVVLLLGAAAARIGLVAAVAAALAFLVAPLPVYYGRYFIHEMMFVAGTLAFLLSGVRLIETRSDSAGIGVGAAAAFMLACKETAVIHFAAAVVPLLWWLWARKSDASQASIRLNRWLKPAMLAAAAFVLATLALYSWGGKNWNGPIDLAKSFPRFAARAGGEGHEKPFWYYAQLLGGDGFGWAWIGLACAGAAVALRLVWNRQSLRPAIPALALYSFAIALLYSAIPYKNPWLALNVWLPMAILAGLGFQRLWSLRTHLAIRGVLAAALIGILAGSAAETWRWCFKRPADDRNPYAYAHTVEDLLGLPERLGELAKEHPNPMIAVVASDPWPLPWYLRGFKRVGYFQPSQDPGRADFYVTSVEPAPRLEARVAGWRADFFGVRPEVLLLLWYPPAQDE